MRIESQRLYRRRSVEVLAGTLQDARANGADYRAAEEALLNHKESGFHAVVGDAIPHDARFPAGDGVLERDHLAGVQRGIFVNGAKSALAVIQQAADDFLRRGIVERKCKGTLASVTAFGPAIGG
jgi:hypothetical protein